MDPVVSKHADSLERLCRRYHVRRLDLFGSATVGQHLSPSSDLDFLVEFQPSARDVYSDAYFGLLEALKQLFGRPVDLVIDSAIKNPYFRQSVEQTRTPIFAA